MFKMFYYMEINGLSTERNGPVTLNDGVFVCESHRGTFFRLAQFNPYLPFIWGWPINFLTGNPDTTDIFKFRVSEVTFCNHVFYEALRTTCNEINL